MRKYKVEVIKHVIVTKFNQLFDDPDINYDNLNISEGWLDSRFILFDEYCFPSVINQSNKNFIWLVFFDRNTPIKYRKIIMDYQCKSTNFHPIFTSESAFSLEPYKIEIGRFMDEKTQILITTRLDNDDALNVQFVDLIQANIYNENDYFLNFPCGLQYDARDGIISKAVLYSNPFISRVERINENGYFNSVLQLKSHTDAGKLHNVFDLGDKNMWLQVIHNHNLTNRLILRNWPLFWFSHFEDLFVLKSKLKISVFNGHVSFFRRIVCRIFQGK